MTPRIYTYVATALVAALLAGVLTWRVQDWRWRANNAAEQADRDAQAELDRQWRAGEESAQRAINDRKAGEHAAAISKLTKQLGDTRAHIATLSTRRCLGADTVGMLNAIGKPAGGGLGLRATTGNAASTAAAAAGSGDNVSKPAPIGEHSADVYASEQDTAKQIAVCRAGYAQISDQLNKILDIEDRRNGQR